MHLILLTRGINHSFEIWKKFMETQWWYWGRRRALADPNKPGEFLKNPDGTYQLGPVEPSKVQGALRPIQLFEYVFPRDGMEIREGKPAIVKDKNLIEALAMINMHNKYQNLRPEINLPAWALRKMMGAKKLPDIPEDMKKKESWQITDKLVPMDGMAVYPIGIRDDVTADISFADGGWNHEQL